MKIVVRSNLDAMLGLEATRTAFIEKLRVERYAARGRKPPVRTLGYQCSDGGKRAAGFTKARNDCVVRALAHALRIPYTEARFAAAVHACRNSDTDGGFFWMLAKEYGFTRLDDLSCMRLEKIEKLLPKVGTFVVATPRHVFCVRDGVILDSWHPGPGAKIRSVYRAPEVRASRLLAAPSV